MPDGRSTSLAYVGRQTWREPGHALRVKLAERGESSEEVSGQANTRCPCPGDAPGEGSWVLPYLV